MGISEKMGDVLGQAVEAKLLREVLEHEIQPKHLAIIMDGNRRFAWRSNLATHVATESENNDWRLSSIGCLNSAFHGSQSMRSQPKI